MANPITNTPQPTRLEAAVATQAGSRLMQFDPDLLSHILTQMGIKDVAAYLNTCRFARMKHFENGALWTELFTSRFPNRTTLLEELGPFEAYKDVHRYRSNLKKGIYAACYPEVPTRILIDKTPLYDSKIICGSELFQLINDYTLKIIDLETGASSLLHLHFGLEPYQIKSFTVADRMLITTSFQDRSIIYWDIDTQECSYICDMPDDWAYFIAIPGGRILSYQVDQTIAVWSAQTLECLHILDAAPFSPDQLTFMYFAEDKIFACVTDLDGTSGKIFIADLIENRWLEPLPGRPGRINSFALENDRLASSSSDGRFFQIWDIPSGQCVSESNMEGNKPTPLSVAMTEGMLFEGTLEYHLKTYDLDQGLFLNTDFPIQHPEKGVQGLIQFQTFADRRLILEGLDDRTIEIRDYDAPHSAVFRELAHRLRFPPPNISEGSMGTYILDRFSRMPQNEKNKIYEEFFHILPQVQKESLLVEFPGSPGTLSEDLLAYMESVFLGPYSHLTLKIRAQAIENYLAKYKINN